MNFAQTNPKAGAAQKGAVIISNKRFCQYRQTSLVSTCSYFTRQTWNTVNKFPVNFVSLGIHWLNIEKYCLYSRYCGKFVTSMAWLLNEQHTPSVVLTSWNRLSHLVWVPFHMQRTSISEHLGVMRWSKCTTVMLLIFNMSCSSIYSAEEAWPMPSKCNMSLNICDKLSADTFPGRSISLAARRAATSEILFILQMVIAGNGMFHVAKWVFSITVTVGVAAFHFHDIQSNTTEAISAESTIPAQAILANK